jgi:hypothetical protein
MTRLAVAAMLALGAVFVGCFESFAEAPLGVLLPPRATRAYHACLFEAWIEDYCHGSASRWTATYDRVYPLCVLANGGGRFPLPGRTWFNTDDYCWDAARHFR